MTADQLHLAGAVVAVFAFLVCVAQLLINEAVHYLWLLLLLAGIVCWVVA